MGSEPTLPYLSPELTGQKLLVGANFASAGIGILNDTGIQFVSPTNIGPYVKIGRERKEEYYREKERENEAILPLFG